MFNIRHFKFITVNSIRNKVNQLCTYSNVPKTSLFVDILNQNAWKNSKLNVSLSCSTLQNILKATGTHDTISSINLKKRPVRKKKSLEDEISKPGIYNVIAFATAEAYNLENLVKGLEKQNLYEPKLFENNIDVIHAVAKYPVEKEPREIFFFRDGMYFK